MKLKMLLILPWIPNVLFGQEGDVKVDGHGTASEVRFPLKTVEPILISKPDGGLPLDEVEYQKFSKFLNSNQEESNKLNYSAKRTTGVSEALGIETKNGQSLRQVNIDETYDFVNDNKIKYNYHNSYVVYTNAADNIVKVESTIERRVGFLMQTFKYVNTYDNSSETSLLIFPNPATSRLSAQYNITAEGVYSLYITDVKGSVVKKVFENRKLNPNSYQDEIELTLTGGAYNIVLESGSQKTSKSLIIKK